MKDRQGAWLLIALIVVICAAVIGGLAWFRARSVSTPAALLERLPTRDGIVLFIDFDTLRRGGILDMLSSPKVAEEPEYRNFVSKTEFNYKQDLDSALVSFNPDGVFFLLRGRFDWKSLRTYVIEQNGTCYNTVCRMVGSTPARRISFFPLQSKLMALAVSTDESAATRLQEVRKDQRPISIPSAPVWVSIPPAALKKTEALPTGTRMFATALADAEKITIALGPQSDHFEVKMDVACRSEEQATALVTNLEKTTSMLRDFIAREKQKPNPNDLSGFLTSGVFHREQRSVIGQWRVERAFLQALTGGE